MRAVIYARKSTESDDRQVQSLEDQLNVLRKLADKESLAVVEEYVESRSAKEPGTRPEFERLISNIRKGKIDVVLTWHPNRLSRNMVDGGVISYLLQTGKFEMIRTPDRTYRSEDNVILLAIENGMATGYVQDLSKGVNRGMQSKAEKGWRPGRVPMGYLNDLNTREIVVDPIRFPMVRRAWELLLTGHMSVAEVHREAVSMGLTQATRKADSPPVSCSAFYMVFTNPFYKGEFTFKGKVYQGKHPAMVSPIEFELAGKLVAKDVGKRVRKNDHPYAGLLFCKKCGCRFVGTHKEKYYPRTGRRAVYRYYHCSGSKGCRKITVSESKISDTFFEVMKTISIPQSLGQFLDQLCVESSERELATATIGDTGLHVRAGKIKARIDKLVNLRLDGELTTSEFREAKDTLDRELAHCERNIDRLKEREMFVRERIKTKLELMSQATSYSTASSFMRRAMLTSLGEKHFVHDQNPEAAIDPIIRLIAKNQTDKMHSGSVKTGKLQHSNSHWQGVIQAIRTMLKEEYESTHMR